MVIVCEKVSGSVQDVPKCGRKLARVCEGISGSGHAVCKSEWEWQGSQVDWVGVVREPGDWVRVDGVSIKV